jgi:glucose dehydrogenase
MVNRGVAYWPPVRRKARARRVFLATLDARLISLDAATGRLRGLRRSGEVDLPRGIENDGPFGNTTTTADGRRRRGDRRLVDLRRSTAHPGVRRSTRI